MPTGYPHQADFRQKLASDFRGFHCLWFLGTMAVLIYPLSCILLGLRLPRRIAGVVL